MSYDPNNDPMCTYCLGRGTIIGPGFFGYLWWRLTGRCIHSRCPECKGTGQIENSARTPD